MCDNGAFIECESGICIVGDDVSIFARCMVLLLATSSKGNANMIVARVTNISQQLPTKNKICHFVRIILNHSKGFALKVRNPYVCHPR